MATQVDQRVVQMQFDNKEFEAGVQETLASLNKLNESIEKNTANSGKEAFSGIEKRMSLANLELAKMENSLANVRDKFSAIGTVADQVLRNITDSVTGFVHNSLSGLFSGPKSGFSEYEEKMGNVQTIMSGTGESVDRVSDALNKLNKYSDETIYSFKDMTANIGKFTNAGVGLDDAVAAIKGIANEAAISGANAQNASHAMYNFAQALSSGYVKLIDWKSIEVANMATQGFKDTLLQTAEALGTVSKQGNMYTTVTTNAKGKTSAAFNATKDFNDSLQYQWMTTKVLTQALQIYATDTRKMTDAEIEAYEAKLKNAGFNQQQIKDLEELGQKAADAAQDVKTFSMMMDTLNEAIGSGWTETWETVFGNFEEAKALWTGLSNILSDVIAKISNARNNALKSWKDMGGRNALLQSLVNILNSLHSIITPIKEAFEDVFGELNGKGIFNATTALERFTDTLILTKSQMANLKNVFVDVFNNIKTGFEIVLRYRKPILSFLALSAMIKGIKNLFLGGLGLNTVVSLIKIIAAYKIFEYVSGLYKTGFKLSDVISAISSKISKLIASIKNSRIFNGIITGLKVVAVLAIAAVAAIVKGISTIISKIKSIDLSGLKNIFENLSFTSVLNGLAKAGSAVVSVFKEIGNVLSSIFIKKTDDAANSVSNLNGAVSGAAANTKEKVSVIGLLVDNIKNKLTSVGEGNKVTIFEFIANSLDKLSSSLKNASEAAGGSKTLLGGFLDKLANVDWQKILAVGYIILYLRYIKKLTSGLNDFADNFGGVGKGITKTLTSIKNYFNSLASMRGSQMFKDIAIGVGILTAALIALAAVPLDPQKITAAATAIGILIAAVTAASAALTAIQAKLSNKINIPGLAMITANIIAMTAAMTVLGVELGVTAVAVNAVMNATTDLGERIARFAVPFALVAGLVAVLVGAMKIFAKNAVDIGAGAISMIELAGGIAALSASIILFNTAVKVMFVQMQTLALMFKGVATAIGAWVAAGETADGMAERQQAVVAAIGLAISAVVGGLVILGTAVKALSALTVPLAGSIALLSVSLLAFGVALQVLSSSMINVDQAAVGIGGALTTLLGVVAILSLPQLTVGVQNVAKIGASFLALSGSMIILAGAIKLMGSIDSTTMTNGVLAIAAGLATLAFAANMLNGVGIGKIAGGILALVAALYLLVPVVALAGIAWEPMAAGMVIIAGGMLSLAGAVKMLQGVNTAGTVATIVAMTAAIGLMAIMIEEIASLPVDTATGAVAAIGVLLVAFAGSISMIGTVVSSFQALDIIGFVATIGTFLAGVAILGSVAVELSNVSGNLTAGVGALLAVMGSLTVVTVILSKIGNSFSAFASIGIAAIIISFSAAVAILSVALQGLAAVPLGTIAATLGIFGGTVIGLTAVIGAFAPALSLLTLALAAATPAILAFAAVLLSIGAAAALFGVACNLISQGVASIVTALVSYLPVAQQFIESIANLTASAGQMAAMAGSLALVGAALLVLSAGAGAIALTGGAAGLALQSMAAGLMALEAALVPVKQALSDFKEKLDKLKESATEWGSNIINGITGGIQAGIGKIQDAGRSIAEGIAGTIKSLLGIHSPSTVGEGIGNNFDQGVANGLESGLDKIKSVAKKIGAFIQDGVHSSDGKEAGEKIGDDIANGVESKENDAQNAGEKTGEAVKEGASEGAEDTGTDLLDTLLDELEEKFPGIKSVADKIGNLFKNGTIDGTNGTGSEIISLLCGDVNSNSEIFKSLSEALGIDAGTLLGQGFYNSAAPYITAMLNYAKAAAAATQKELNAINQANKYIDSKGNTYNKNSGGVGSDVAAQRAEQNAARRAYKQFGADTSNDKDTTFNIQDLLPDFDSLTNQINSNTKALDDNSSATDDNSKKNGKNSKAKKGNTGATKDNSKALMEEAERLKNIAKFEERATGVVDEFSKSLYAMTAASNTGTTAMAFTKDAFQLLLKEIYDASSDADTIAQNDENKGTSLVQYADKIRQAFTKAFDEIKKSVEDALDYFQEFDTKTSDILKPEKLLSNAQSQVNGLTKAGEALQRLSFRGLSESIIADLGKNPLSNYKQIMALDRSTNEQIEKFNEIAGDSENLAKNYTTLYMSSRMVALSLKKLGIDGSKAYSKLDKKTQAYVDLMNELTDAQKKEVDLTKTVYGNIDLNNRQTLTWTDDNLTKYSTELDSWGEKAKDLKDNISTVFGQSAEFNGTEIAFSPMLQTDNGPVFLSKDTVYSYIQQITDAATDASGKVDSATLFALDAEGIEVDGQKIKGLIADIGETAKKTGEAMHFAGNTGAIALATQEVQKYAEEAGMSFEEFTKTLQENTDISTINAATAIENVANLYEALSLASKGVDDFDTAIEEFSETASDALSNFGSMFTEYTLDWDLTTEQLMTNVRNHLEGIKLFKENLDKLVASGLDLRAATDLAKQGAETVAVALELSPEDKEEINKSYAEYTKIIEDEKDDAAKAAKESGTLAGKTYAQAIKEQAEAEENIKSLADSLSSLLTKAAESGASDASVKIVEAAVEAIATALDEDNASVNNIVTVSKKTGEVITTNTAKGVDETKDTVTTATTTMAKDANEAAQTEASKEKGYEGGKNYTEGWANGLADSGAMASVQANASNIGKTTDSSAKGAVKEKSPSKVALEGGKFYVQGWANGLADNSKLSLVKKNSENIGKLTDKTLRKTLKINSPSLVAYADGAYTTEGFAEGETDLDALSKVADGASTVVETANEAMVETISTKFNAGTIIAETVANDISDSTSTVSDAASKSTLIAAKYAAHTYVSTFADGLISEMKSSSSAIKTATNSIADLFEKSLRKKLEGTNNALAKSVEEAKKAVQVARENYKVAKNDYEIKKAISDEYEKQYKAANKVYEQESMSYSERKTQLEQQIKYYEKLDELNKSSDSASRIQKLKDEINSLSSSGIKRLQEIDDELTKLESSQSDYSDTISALQNERTEIGKTVNRENYNKVLALNEQIGAEQKSKSAIDSKIASLKKEKNSLEKSTSAEAKAAKVKRDAAKQAYDIAKEAADESKEVMEQRKTELETANKEFKLARKYQKEYLEYQNNAIPVLRKFGTSIGNIYGIVGNTTPIENATYIFTKFVSSLYEVDDISEVLEDDAEGVSMTVEERAYKIQEAFNKVFEEIKSGILESIDYFEEFDRKLDSTLSPEKLLSNIESQISGNDEFYSMIESIAYRAPAAMQDYIYELAKGGVSNIDKVRAIYDMSIDEMDQFEKKMEEVSSKSDDWAASVMMPELMKESVNQLNTWAEQVGEVSDKIQKDAKTIRFTEPEYVDEAENYLKSVGGYRTFDTFDGLKASLKEATALGVDFNKTIYGNIDMNNRKVLEWTDENLDKWGDVLKSLKLDAKKLKGTSTAIIGMWDTYQGIDVAFTPMLQTEDGSQMLTKDTIDEYVNGLIDELNKSGKKWSYDDFMLADQKGLEINGQKISKIIADVGNNAKNVASQMRFVGPDSDISKDMEYFTSLAQSTGMTTDELLQNLKENFGDVVDEGDDAATAFRKIVEAERELNEWSKETGVSVKTLQQTLGARDALKMVETFKQIQDALVQSKQKVEEFQKAAEDMATTVSEAISNSLSSPFSKIQETAEEDMVTGTDLLTNLQNHVTSSANYLGDIQNLIQKGIDLDVIKGLISEGQDAVAAATSWTEEQWKQAEDLFNQIKELEQSAAEWTKESVLDSFKINGESYSDAVKEWFVNTKISEAFATELNDKLTEKLGADVDAGDALRKWLDSLSQSINDNEEELNSTMATLTGDMMESFGTSLTEQSVGAKNAANKTILDVVREMQSKASSEHYELYDIGYNIILGVLNGLTSSQAYNAIYNATSETANAILNQWRANLGIASPSKKAMELGDFFVQGLAIGLTNDGAILSAANKTTDTMVSTMNDALEEARAILSGEKGFSPTITPVVDMQNVRYAQNAISSMSAQVAGLNLNANIGSINTPNSMIAASLSKDSKYDDKNIINAINNLETDIAGMRREIAGMQITLDSGALVGELTPGINTQLGRIYRRQSRQ